MKAAIVAALLTAAPLVAAGQSVPRVTPGWGVDTAAAAWSEQAWHGAVADIYRLWRSYLTSSPERQAPTELWSAAEQRRWPVYDHTAGTQALRHLLRSGRSNEELRVSVANLLGMSWGEVAAAWRARILASGDA